eukprot:551303-Pyramimonas_sp.AAC.1
MPGEFAKIPQPILDTRPFGLAYPHPRHVQRQRSIPTTIQHTFQQFSRIVLEAPVRQRSYL